MGFAQDVIVDLVFTLRRVLWSGVGAFGGLEEFGWWNSVIGILFLEVWKFGFALELKLIAGFWSDLVLQSKNGNFFFFEDFIIALLNQVLFI